MCLKIIILSINFWILFNFVSSQLHDGDFVETRIYKGNIAKVGQFPYAGILSYIQEKAYATKKVSSRSYSCTGSIIHRNWGLTAAHCVHESRGSPTFTVGGIFFNRSDGESYPIQRFYPHFKYDFHVLHKGTDFEELVHDDYDVALMKFAKPIDFNDNVKPAHLEWDPDKNYDGQACTILGWGYVEEPEDEFPIPTPSLLFLNSAALEPTKCNAIYNKYERNWQVKPAIHICVSPEKSHKTACSGDSGGPLMSGGKQIGIHVVGLCGDDIPSAYATTSSIFEWIRQHMIECGDEDLYDIYGGERHTLFEDFTPNRHKCDHPDEYGQYLYLP